MSLSSVRSLLFEILKMQPVSRIAMVLGRILKPAVREALLTRIPVTGEVPVEVRNDVQFVLSTDGRDSIASAIYWNGADAFESHETTIFLSLAREARVVLDVGANTGYYSLLAATANPRAHVYSFEPVPAIYGQLERNVVVNRCQNITPVHAAVADTDGITELYVPRQLTNPLGASMASGFRQNTIAVRVDSLQIDTYTTAMGIGQVDVMKIDTESTEPAVLTGGQSTVSSDRPLIMCEVLRGRSESDLMAFFEGRSYRYFNIDGPSLVEKTVIEGDNARPNYLFVPVEKTNLLAGAIDMEQIT